MGKSKDRPAREKKKPKKDKTGEEQAIRSRINHAPEYPNLEMVEW